MYIPKHIETSFQGMERISKLYNEARSSTEGVITLDFDKVRNLDANMSACIGGIIEQLRKDGKQVEVLYSESGRANLTLRKNGFYSTYCGKPLLDDKYDTVIEYRHFKNNIVSSFAKYAGSYFHPETNGFQEIPDKLLKEFRRSLNEVAGNTFNHAESTSGFITCGQFFPQKHLIKFTMVDTGVGIAAHIEKNRSICLKDHDAVRWALTGNNTGRPISAGTSGGLGLKQIKEFIHKNAGEMYIISKSGYYNLLQKKDLFQPIYPAFPGTVVSLCINTHRGML